MFRGNVMIQNNIHLACADKNIDISKIQVNVFFSDTFISENKICHVIGHHIFIYMLDMYSPVTRYHPGLP